MMQNNDDQIKHDQNNRYQDNEKVLQQLKDNNATLHASNIKLTEINANMLKVFWIVAVFALLYFGLMIYMLFYR
jgi:hypothetical protein